MRNIAIVTDSTTDLPSNIYEVYEEADEMEQNIMQRFNPLQIIRVKIGIVVGSHLGIGGLGITFFEK